MNPHDLEDSPLVALARMIVEACHWDTQQGGSNPASVTTGLRSSSSSIGAEPRLNPPSASGDAEREERWNQHPPRRTESKLSPLDAPIPNDHSSIAALALNNDRRIGVSEVGSILPCEVLESNVDSATCFVESTLPIEAGGHGPDDRADNPEPTPALGNQPRNAHPIPPRSGRP